MTPADAARILEIAVDSTTESLEVRFKEIRARLEDKIAKAPTDGLKAKYRESLAAATQAYEVLSVAADSSTLPVLKKEAEGSTPLQPAGDGKAATTPRGQEPVRRESRAAKPKSSNEFLVVSVIAVVVLGAGGWWVMKIRAEKAEAKAEAERQAVTARAEQEKAEKLQVSLRADLAELRTHWEIFERAERDAEQSATEARNELRSLRDAPAGRQRELELRAEAASDYAQWLANHLLRHPVRATRSRAEELMSVGAVDQARPLIEELKKDFAALETEILTEKARRLNITGTLEITSEPAGLSWSLVDTFGLSRSGITPARVTEIGSGQARVTFRRPGWSDLTKEVAITRNETTAVTGELMTGVLRVESTPSGAEVILDGRVIGVTPFVLSDFVPQWVDVTLRLKGYNSASLSGEVAQRKELRLATALERARPPTQGQSFTIPELALSIVPIPAGSFDMGTASGGEIWERPVTQVTITQPYWLGATEVTQKQWVALMGSNPSVFKGEDLPVETITWNDAMDFCLRLTERERGAGRLPEGYVYTLPTEAQWEYACRAGTTGEYAGALDAMGWYDANSGGQTHPVGQKQPNAWGLFDMHGNLNELCLDWSGKYTGGSVTDPRGPSSGSVRVFRGGCWDSYATNCRSARRDATLQHTKYKIFGFRIALSPAP